MFKKGLCIMVLLFCGFMFGFVEKGHSNHQIVDARVSQTFDICGPGDDFEVFSIGGPGDDFEVFSIGGPGDDFEVF